jgi:hypothetical protein
MTFIHMVRIPVMNIHTFLAIPLLVPSIVRFDQTMLLLSWYRGIDFGVRSIILHLK